MLEQVNQPPIVTQPAPNNFKVPLIIRGEVIEDYSLEFGARHEGRAFMTPDIDKYINKLVNKSPDSLSDLYRVSLGEIFEFLDALGKRLDLDTNPYWREAFEVSCHFSNLSRPVLENIYRNCNRYFKVDNLIETVETRIGSAYLEGWVPITLNNGAMLSVRAIGARAVHVIAGNIPVVACSTLVRSAYTRSDSIVKLPSNDPLTAIALARTMIEMDPDHPVTKHFSVAYWKGGDEAVESKLYRPANIEKICAWGGYNSIRHISKYIGPGIDLITLDPKSSTSLIGREAFADDATMRSVASRVAADIGGYDQEACANTRVMFLESGTDAEGIARANTFGDYVYQAIQALPTAVSNGPVEFDQKLMAEIKAILPLDSFYKIFTDRKQIEKSGAIIVSQLGEQVDFPELLYGRVANIVPVDEIRDAVRYFTAATQTVGIFPDSLRRELRDRAALAGGQRFVSLGYAIGGTAPAPQDGIEPERRMCKWVSDYEVDAEANPGIWATP